MAQLKLKVYCQNNFTMKIYKKLYLTVSIFIVFFINSLNHTYAKDVKIIMKVNNEIITNVDIENEYTYLIALNKNLEAIEKKKILLLAKESLIKEKIKKIEILKYFELGKNNLLIDNIIKSIYQNLNINDEEEFKNYLKSYGITFNEVYKKIEIESVWNQIIYERYKNKIVINEENLKQKILNNPKKINSVLLSEIVFDFKNKNEIEDKYQEILKSIEDIGFKESVIKFSISESRNNFGSLGWVNENILSNKIKDKIKNLEIGQITTPIIMSSGMLILKLEDRKIESYEIDLNQELSNLKKFQTNNQLNNFSIVYFNKVKNNLTINEY